MPRTRTFEPEEALTGVMDVFWSKGFDKTSYDDLVAATGVSRKGLYTVFGDKDALFVKALRHYRATVVPVLFKALGDEDVTIGSIRDMLRGFADMIADGEVPHGCFMTNTAGEAAIQRPDVRKVYNRHIDLMKQEFRDAFMRTGLPSDEAARLGAYYTGVMQGILILAHARSDSDFIKTVMETALKELP